MKKLIIGISIILSVIGFSFAFTANELKTNLNNNYNNAITNGTNIFKKYKKIITNINNNISTGDYKILSQLTNVNTDSLFNNIKNRYKNLIQTATTNKLNILGKIEIANNNFSNNLISTGEYNSKLNNIKSEISGYILDTNTQIQNFNTTISGNINNFSNDLKSKLNTYKTKISNYKNFKNKLNNLSDNYDKLIKDNNKLNKIIGAGKEILDKRSNDLKKNVINYYSGMLNNEFQKYLEQDNNMIYLQSDFNSKKQILLGFVNDKLVNTITNIMDTYYPDVNIPEITSGVNELKKSKINNIVENYNNLILQISNLQDKITTTHNKINEKLNKLGNSENKINIFKVLENELIQKMNDVTKVVQKETKQTLKNYLDLIKDKEKAEQPIMTQLMIDYNTKMSKDNLTGLNNFIESLNNYKDIIVLPQNIDIINKYIKAVKTKIENLKLKNITDKLNNLQNKIKNLQISNNFDKINEFSGEIAQLENIVPENFKKQLQQEKYLLQIKNNLNKLFKIGAIRYYYKNGDLTNEVANILRKYYDKYKANNKEDIFNKKINKAFEKIEILEDNLQNDKRSYYIIMIHNGLLKFKSDLLK